MKIRKWLEQRQIWFHSSNDNRNAKHEIIGSKFWRGRFFLYIRRLHFTFGWGFANFARSFYLMFYLTRSERSIAISFCIPFLFAFNFRIEGLPFLNYTKLETDQREIGVRVFSWTIWLSLWGDGDGWGPRRQANIDIERLLFGKKRYKSENIDPDPVPIVVKMPEAEYPGTAQRFVSTWSYPRFRRSQSIQRVKIDIPAGIPVPGKGENSWDLDDDAIFGVTCPAESIETAIEQVKASAFRTREKYGWSGVE